MPTTYAIPNGRTVMDATLYTGTGSGGLTVTNSDLGSNGFYPDLIWIKSRNAAYYNTLLDYQRGASVRLFSNLTDAESNNGCQSSFNSNGFTLNADAGGVNNSGTTYVAWQWNAGSGTSSSNTNGFITSQVDVNTTAGFSIVKYTGNGSATSVGHGLGAVPGMMIFKDRGNATYNWAVWHTSLGGGDYALQLNNVNGSTNAYDYWNGTPSTTTFGLGTDNGVNKSGDNYIAYCWAPVAGFSQFGSYVGNGSTDGPFVYTGFRPKFILIKNTGTIGGYGNWSIIDTTRNTYNAANTQLRPDESTSENTNTAYNVDLLSNGFKLRTSYNDFNASGYTYIYAVFAENPFKYANAR